MNVYLPHGSNFQVKAPLMPLSLQNKLNNVTGPYHT